MTIKIYSDRIDIGDFTLFEGGGGVQFDGVARAENFRGGAGTFQGSVSGYGVGGAATSPTIIQKYPFATDSNSTNVGTFPTGVGGQSTQTSPTHGYGIKTNTIQKFPFANDALGVDFSTMGVGGSSGTSSSTHGYDSNVGGGYSNTISKFPFAIDSAGVDVGDLTLGRGAMAGHSSTTHGYHSGGFRNTPIPHDDNIDKYSFTSDGNATDVGNLITGLRTQSGLSSTTHGYSAGGGVPPGPSPSPVNTLQKFPFSTDTNTTDVGDLTRATLLFSSNGASSDRSGYNNGGNNPGLRTNEIDKFSFATNGNATDVGDLTAGAYFVGGTQV